MASGLRRSGGGGNNITVAVRVRPLSEKEQARKSHNCLVVQEGKQINVNEVPCAAGTHRARRALDGPCRRVDLRDSSAHDAPSRRPHAAVRSARSRGCRAAARRGHGDPAPQRPRRHAWVGARLGNGRRAPPPFARAPDRPAYLTDARRARIGARASARGEPAACEDGADERDVTANLIRMKSNEDPEMDTVE